MGEQKIREDCYQKHNCQEIYKKLANTKGHSVAFKVVAAFLLPILVFIASLAAFERILAEAIHGNELQIVLNFLLALLPAGVCVLVIRALSHRCENREPEKGLLPFPINKFNFLTRLRRRCFNRFLRFGTTKSCLRSE